MTRNVAHTTPYAWPWDGALDPGRVALVVISPRLGGDRLPDSRIWQEVRATAGTVQSVGGAVVQVTTTPPDRSAGVRDEHAVVGADHVLDAAGIDGFYGSPLDGLLRRLRRDQLLLAGAWLETGVHSTMRSANDRGFECLLVLDACLAYEPALEAASRSQIEMSGGIFGAVGQSVDVCAAITSA
ncbi:isochorismatase family protein [Nocardioides immobilis]|uniref:Isochorismatase family protein n=1 Tax=Nocardioides immobilis TaxID=2049295 RepID=A0A417Y2Z8_9ACTN|nr:isochorismatase family protein [Nocardioides immobilis]RHW27038.1 isochorismatase family protein [Nocardioides immobilis]